MKQVICILALVAISAVSAQAATIFIVPTVIEKSWYSGVGTRAFDNQPTWDDVQGMPVGGDMSFDSFGGYANRLTYLDFGENWANTSITQTWTHYRPLKDNPYGSTPYTVRWDNDDDNSNGDLAAELTLNFHMNVPANTGDGSPWYLDVDTSAAPVQCKARYLTLLSGNPDTGNMNEWAIRGTVIPEPASLAMLAMGGLALLHRRRR